MHTKFGLGKSSLHTGWEDWVQIDLNRNELWAWETDWTVFGCDWIKYLWMTVLKYWVYSLSPFLSPMVLRPVFGSWPPLSGLQDCTQTHSVGLLWMSDYSRPETSTWQHTTLTTYRQTSMPPGFEPAIPASEPPQTHALDRAASEIGIASLSTRNC
jgi:hypothetical protein